MGNIVALHDSELFAPESELVPFDFNGAQVRTFIEDGEVLWVAADVATLIGYGLTSTMTRRIDEDDKGVRDLHTPGGVQSVVVVNESGLYAAILGSRHEGARKFKKWVTSEVLPSIRRTGGYGQVQTAPELPTNFLDALKALVASEESKLELEASLKAQTAQIEADAPKLDHFNALIDSDGLYSLGAVAKLYGIGRTTFTQTLRRIGVFQQKSTEPYQQYMDRGIFEMKLSPYTDSTGTIQYSATTKVTADGVAKLARILLRKGVALPAYIDDSY